MVSSADFRSLTEGSLDVQLLVYREKSSGERTQPCGAPVLIVRVLDEVDQCGVVCRLQELDRGVSRCAVVGVQGEEQWGENTALRSSSADRAGAG